MSGGTDHPADLSAEDSGRYRGACPKGEPIRLPPKAAVREQDAAMVEAVTGVICGGGVGRGAGSFLLKSDLLVRGVFTPVD